MLSEARSSRCRATLLALMALAVACEAQSQSGKSGGSGDDDGDSGGGGGGGGSGGGAPEVPRGAFSVALANEGGMCMVASHSAVLGNVSAMSKAITVGNGEGAAIIDCTITGTGPWGIVASATQAGNQLSIEATMSATSTLMMPALGKVTFASTTSVQPMTSSGPTCEFWFESGTLQGVADKGVWVTFQCDAVTGGSAGTCGINTSYAAFENCGP